MAEQHVVGFFDTMAEAQQAVQRLLAGGFTRETVTLSAPTDLNLTTPGGSAEPDSSSGRFLSSLFSEKADSRIDAAHANAGVNQRPGTLVTVKTQLAGEARQVAELLRAAGAADITVEDNG